MHVGYVRVSTIEQNEARQLEAMKQYPIERMFIEKASAKDTNRPRLQELLDYVRDGDVLHVHDFSRLARSTKDLLAIVELLNAKGVHLVSNKENIDTSTPTGRLMLTMIAAIAQFERDNLLERQREGINIAVQNGKYKGRKRVTVPDFAQHYARYIRREVTKSALAKELGISRPTLDRLIDEQRKVG